MRSNKTCIFFYYFPSIYYLHQKITGLENFDSKAKEWDLEPSKVERAALMA